MEIFPFFALKHEKNVTLHFMTNTTEINTIYGLYIKVARCI